ncbi:MULTISPECIES: 2,5-diamino-6-(ribosylamino)-4(3H)-pyrimidinone 5'-phosphate reductase [Methanoculleus]|uniref:2,5-diamino-6-(ribosylamino)-4(3H)-pyrimidinone 5'-phosphate reductase n=2 Tax=Methanoculleus TaxID=45989 RepID=A3CX52_METMJ|nr:MULTISPECIES: 2,5-diamino-6-(ribosylamino)-4(3H)-pyrimidinone 5'-phosphate reductase [Methanoculleus]ABN57952.1 2,5-diamino-6-(5-phosphoribosylamino)pyrimidin-4(3H)-one reductase [Methanoculleus marisnigri JR1]MCC7556201.1 2,5-diamino-6-(ribosylamino)-4(3H)-pyrimidinone 5'-phosphate reductase [Methanoculleus marisnigri]UYU19335.1 2,5-diamino-6-(ribosylamino)-4(3H)-pyrimidinone 5'-phosphate reductase [Methanoculleus submarinus]
MRPFVFVNIAMSADGKISTRERRQVRISGNEDYLRVDRIKAESDAIMVGIGTVLADNPSLTVKSPELRAERRAAGKDENPIRIVVDGRGRTPPDADILHKGSGKRIVAVSKKAPKKAVEALREQAAVVVGGEETVDLRGLLEELHRQGVRRLMVEGGGTLIWTLFEQGLVDELQAFVGNIVIGGKEAPTPTDGAGFLREEDFPRLRIIEAVRFDDGLLVRWEVERT